MRPHLPVLDHGRMDPAPCPYVIRINGHLGATMLSAFPALAPRHHGAHTVLTGLLDRSALYGVLAEIETLGLDLLELRKLTPDRESPGSGHHRSPLRPLPLAVSVPLLEGAAPMSMFDYDARPVTPGVVLVDTTASGYWVFPPASAAANWRPAQWYRRAGLVPNCCWPGP